MKASPDLNDSHCADGIDAVRARSDKARVLDGHDTAPTSTTTGLVFKCLSDIAPQAIKWLWKGRLALGKLTILAGEPGVGKSQIGLSSTSHISTGERWADGDEPMQGSVIILSAEDAAADTVRPRLEAAGADLSRIHILEAAYDTDGKRRTFNLQSDLAALGDKIAALGDVRLVIIDPVTSYMGKIDSHRTSDVRAVLEPLANLAERFNVSVLAISHPPKNAPAKALHAVTGSLGFVAAARIVLIAIEEPDGDGRQLLLPAKNNLGPLPVGLGYRRVQRCVTNGIIASYVEWDTRPVTMTANEVLAATADNARNGGATSQAVDFLREQLADGAKLATKMKDEADARGIAERTLKRARQALHVDAFKEGFQGPWMWRLP
jgi:hypothetical protein